VTQFKHIGHKTGYRTLYEYTEYNSR